MESVILTYVILIGVSIFGFYVLCFFFPFGVWLKAIVSGVRIPLLDLIEMKLRRIAPSPIVRSMIMAAKAGIEIQQDALEAHSLAGGNVEHVVTEMINAHNREEHLSFYDACYKDLASKNLTKES